MQPGLEGGRILIVRSGSRNIDGYLKDQYKDVGNNPIVWESSANHLLIACKVLDRDWKKAHQ